jgi:hypothetical protein
VETYTDLILSLLTHDVTPEQVITVFLPSLYETTSEQVITGSLTLITVYETTSEQVIAGSLYPHYMKPHVEQIITGSLTLII